MTGLYARRLTVLERDALHPAAGSLAEMSDDDLDFLIDIRLRTNAEAITEAELLRAEQLSRLYLSGPMPEHLARMTEPELDAEIDRLKANATSAVVVTAPHPLKET